LNGGLFSAEEGESGSGGSSDVCSDEEEAISAEKEKGINVQKLNGNQADSRWV
jgi:hypothetical protein